MNLSADQATSHNAKPQVNIIMQLSNGAPTCNSKLIVEHRVLSPRLVLIPTEPHWLLLMRPLLLVQLSCCSLPG